MPNVAFHTVSKTFSTTQALSEVSFVCREGEIHALLGENGAGKSTLAGLLAGFYLPTAGEITIADAAMCLDSPQKSLQCGIGVVFQHPLLVPELTVIENLSLGNAWWKAHTVQSSLVHYEELCSLLGIHIDAHRRVKHLSLGEQQYVEIMRALWHQQKILVFDEATALLCPKEAERVGSIMQMLADKGHTILYITHKLQEAISYSHRMTILRQGKKVAEISPEAIAKAKCHKNVQQFEHDLCRYIFGEQSNESLVSQKKYAEKIIEVHHGGEGSRTGIPLLKARDLSSHSEEHACPIKDISFEIYGNEILGIAGIDGNGQKHFAEILAGQRMPQKGSLFLHGEEITELRNAQRQKLGIHYASEDRLYEGLVGSEDIAFNLQVKNIGLKPFWKYGIAKWKHIQSHARKIMESLFIPQEHQKSSTRSLSGGTIQKIILARELNQPKLCVCILHQPTHGLDVRTAKELHEKIRFKLYEKCSFILISSDLNELLSLSTHIAVMKNGTLSDSFVNDADSYKKMTDAMAIH